jgi:hypothetical protein
LNPKLLLLLLLLYMNRKDVDFSGVLEVFYWEGSIVGTAKSVCVIWVLTFLSVSDTGFLEILPAYQFLVQPA